MSDRCGYKGCRRLVTVRFTFRGRGGRILNEGTCSSHATDLELGAYSWGEVLISREVLRSGTSAVIIEDLCIAGVLLVLGIAGLVTVHLAGVLWCQHG